MRLLGIAVANKRWDLAAHTIVLATAGILNNGDKPHISRKATNNPSLRMSGGSDAGRVTKSDGGEFEGKKGSSQR